MERFDRQRCSDRLYRAPQWRAGGDAYHDDLRRCGLVRWNLQLHCAARDAAGNLSPDSASVSVTIADTTPPTTPTGLTATVAGPTGANLSWSASTDNVGVTGYIVRRNGVQVATPTTTSFADTGLSAAMTYSYT